MRSALGALLLTALAASAAPQTATVPGESAAGEGTPALPDANQLVRSMVDRQRSFEKAIDDYTYDVLSTQEKLDGQNRVKERRVRRYQIFFVEGQPVPALVEEDGRPLTPDRQREEEKRVHKAAQEAVERHRKHVAERDKEDLRISEILTRFDFTSVARENVNGRPAILVRFKPLPGKRDIKRDNVLRALQGRLWIDEKESAVARAEISNAQKITFGGGVLASVSSLTSVLDFVPVNEVWLPRRVEVSVAGRVLLVKGFRQRVDEQYSNYRRFMVSTEDHLVGQAGPATAEPTPTPQAGQP